jgi:hypothetical protein
MKHHSFSLLPFVAPSNFPPDVQLVGSLARSSGSLFLQYELSGNLSEILLPEQEAVPARKNNLWQKTCCEFFVAVRDSPRYWEVNLAPSGDWNVYAFESCRVGMNEEAAFHALPFQAERRPESFLLQLEFALAKIISKEQPIDLAVSAVIQLRDGRSSCWALTHCGSMPDFHLRESFVLKLPAQEENVHAR